MFTDGLKKSPERATTRQVIYYVTNSNTLVGTAVYPNTTNFRAVNSVMLDQFKQTGTIVVNRELKFDI